ncbi:MAG TPA: DUF1905 domain-containing protein [Planctomycetota bacterium]|jgi:hypothetical protein|nr:DUF1905 domain-containing protein [Planctomycetota bacterium]
MARRAKKKSANRASATKAAAPLRFDAVVERGHKGCAFVLPLAPGTRAAPRGRWFVRGTVAGARFEGEVGLRWGRYFMCVDDESLRALGLAEGDTARVTMRRRAPNDLDPPKLPRLPGVRLVVRPG